MTYPVGKARTLAEVLRWRAEHQPEAVAYTHLRDGEGQEESLTYCELDQRARAIAAELRGRCRRGDRALLVFPSGLDFLAAFVGCWYGDVVPVPALPPRPNRPDSRMRAIAADAGVAQVLTTAALGERLAVSSGQDPWLDREVPELLVDRIDPGLAATWRDSGAAAESLALLQYTSGSTGTPKGVMVDHRNLMHNQEMIRLGFGHDGEVRILSWLPSYHDMGLIGMLLQPLYLGCPCVFFSPQAFLQKPSRWLQGISRYRITSTGGPNFAYDLCWRTIAEEPRRELDLSSWRVAFCGSEPVRAETLERFTAAFAPCGFHREALLPCYGLAEATLFVTGHLDPDRPAPRLATRDGVGFVGCGRGWLDQDLRIVDPENGRERPAGAVGEIWVASPSVALGYWDRPEKTAETFAAALPDARERRFLRTGDLGFVQDGELFVTGRLKDLVIIRGRNHYPQDLEKTVEGAYPAMRPNSGAAFSIEQAGEERLVVVQEVERTALRSLDLQAVAAAVRQAIREEHEVQLHALVLLKPGGVPRTSSGKIQRRACREAYLAGELPVVGRWEREPEPAAEDRPPESASGSAAMAAPAPAEVESWLIDRLAVRLGLAPDQLDIGRPLAEYDLDSLAAVRLSGELGEWLGRELSPTLVYDYPTIRALAQYLAGSGSIPDRAAVSPARNGPVAIIGMGCRFPGADDPAAFWSLLREGIDAIREVPAARWRVTEDTSRWGGFLGQVDGFDPAFFGLSPREAARMDAQQRLLLEVAWETCEDAGLDPASLAGTATGVFVGISTSDYSLLHLADPERVDAHTGTGNAHSIAANRLSYFLDLRGPSVAVDTACSSSLVAVHQACRALQQGDCRLALAGGVNLMLTPHWHRTFSLAGMMAADGRCKTFDAEADGYVRGEGCGLVLLKRLEDARRDGDPVLAIVLGSAVNQDGRSNGLTAPNGPAQTEVIRRALVSAGVGPEVIGYVEAHGTGTTLGDPIEMAALQAALAPGETAAGPCAVGSVKTNIGHLEAAAGIAGLLKVILALRHAELPPHLHLRRLNPAIRLEGSRFFVPTEPVPWPGCGPRLAGVSSFGFGGTNAHLVIGAGDDSPPLRPTRSEPRLLVLSAHAPAALDESARRLAVYLQSHPDADLEDLGLALAVGRGRFPHRLAVVGDTPAEMAGKLGVNAAGKRTTDTVRGQAGPRPRMAFLCAGQGSQLPGMGRGLYEGEPVFRAVINRCDALLRETLRPGLLEVLYGDAGDPQTVHRTEYAQPALFALEHALIQLWRSWGVEPDLVVGHSVGELAAACAAGVFSLEDGLHLAAARGRLMQTLPAEGAMATVRGEPGIVAAAVARVAPEVVVAAVNQPGLVTVSGPRAAVVAAVARFRAEGLQSRLLEVAHAFHSAAVDPVLPELERLAGGLSLSLPSLPLISSVTGVPEHQRLTESRYWARQAREPVQFAPALEAARQAGAEVFVEIGPAPVLLALVPQAAEGSRTILVPSLRPGREDRRVALLGLGTLFAAGVTVDWSAVYPTARRASLGLPGYPFQRQRCWLEPQPGRPTPKAAASLAEESDLYDLTWEEAPPPRPGATGGNGTWLLLGEGAGLAASLAVELSASGGTVRCLHDPADLADAVAGCAGPVHLVPLTALDLAAGPPAGAAALMAAQEGGVLVALAAHRTLAGLLPGRSGTLHLVTRGAQAVSAKDPLNALGQAPLWGLARTLAVEHPESWGGIIDLDPALDPVSAARAVALELRSGDDEDQVAWRGARRHVPRLRALARPASAAIPAIAIDPTATYLVAGGLGELGRHTAQWLIEHGARHLTLCGRRVLPERSSWAGLPPESSAAGAVRVVRDLEARGAAVEAVACDITDATAVRALFARFGRDLPALKGIVHAAGTVSRSQAVALDEAAVRQVLAPRLAGAWNLHLASIATPLDFFLLHGSIAAIWGSAELAHYSAANAFLDGLARYRQAAGLPGLCVDWGPWADGGMAAVDGGRELADRGIAALDAASALDTLGRLLGIGLSQAICCRVDWRRLRPLLEIRRRRPLLEHLPGGRTDEALSQPLEAAGGSVLLQQLRAAGPREARSLLVSHLRQALAALLEITDAATVGLDLGFQDLGLDSLMAVELRDRLERELALSLPATLAFDYPTVAQMAAFLSERLAAAPGSESVRRATVPVSAPRDRDMDEIAVVGMACRFPGGADTPEALWELLRGGVDAIGPVPADRWDREALYDPDPETPGRIYARQGGFLSRIDAFDHRFFGISPREAVQLDPQQRLLLEVAWEALERAGLPPERSRGSRAGVWVGIGSNDYQHLLGGERLTEVDAYTGTGNALAFAAGRLAHVLGLQGPVISVDTACSSSLVAVHLACQALRAGEADRALAGGVSLILSPRVAVYLSRARALSPDGRCKTFDAAADGYGRGEGCGVVVLRRLADARRDGDPVLAVIRGSAVNHDGPSGGLTVPNVHAQVALLRQALAAAGVAPSAVDYVEAHGTGTALGDPIEMQALCTALGPGRGEDRPLVVGSIKTNIGHLEAAAGMAGLLKVVLALQHRTIPAHLHLRQLNPHIDLGGVPVEIPVTPRPWPARGDRRLAGVSAFGLSGTNAHLLIGETDGAEAVPPAGPRRPLHLLKVTARDPEALKDLAEQHAAALATAEPSSWCAAANLGRSDHGQRLAVVGADGVELATALRAAAAASSAGRDVDAPPPRVAFLFTGQGAQFARMGHHLYETEPVYRQVLDQCAEILRPHLEVPLIEVLEAQPGPDSPLDQTAYCQPALFAVEAALAALWRSWGIEPVAVLGHSLGELTAAFVAGVYSLEDGLRLAAARGRLIQSLPAGGTMAVLLAPEEQVAPLVEARCDEVAVAAVNGPRQTVISGTAGAVAEVIKALAAQGVRHRRLHVSHAFHSPLMEPILAGFQSEVGRVPLEVPRLPLVSALTGEVADSRVATAGFWRDHLRQPVRFSAAVQALARLGCEAVIEVGPEALLAAVERSAPQAGRLLLPSLRRDGEAWRPLLESLAALYGAGAAVEWSAVYGAGGAGPHPYHLLPAYPFRRVRHWPAAATGSAPRSAAATPPQALLGRRTRSPLLESEIFEACWSASAPPCLGDHRLFDTVVAPAAAHLVMALAAGREWRGQTGGSLSDLSFPRALALDEGQERVVQLILRPVEDRTARFEIISLDPEGDGYRRHAEGIIGDSRVQTAETIEAVDLAAGRDRCREEREAAGFYARFHQAGYTLGPAFRWIDRIWRAPGEALGRLRAPAVPDAGAYPLHPGLVDSCFQLLAHCLDGGDEPLADGRMFVPVAVERCVYLASPGDAEVWCHARLRPEVGEDTLIADLRLTDPQGRVLVSFAGLTVRRLDRRHLTGGTTAGGELHELRWRTLRRDRGPDPTGEWLICGGPADLAAGLADTVIAAGGRVEVAASGHGAGIEPSEVVFLAGLEPWTASPDGPRHEVIRPAVERLRELLRSLVPAGRPCRLWLVTRGARALPGDGFLDPDQALLAGLQPTLALEYPELRCATVDLPLPPVASEAADLVHLIRAAGQETQLALRPTGRWVLRLVPASRFRGGIAAEPRALELPQRGLIDHLAWQPVHRPVPGAGEVEVRVSYAGLNLRDVLQALDVYPGEPTPLGGEAAGVVERVGPGITGVRPGDRVVSLLAPGGSFRTYATCPQERIFALPPGLDLGIAASLPVAWLTAAWGLERLAAVRPGEWVLIHAAAGGVGLAAVRIAQRAGARVIGTAGSEEKRAFLRSLGVESVADSRSLSFVEVVRQATAGRGVDAVVNSLAAPFIEPSMALLAPGGRFIELGKADLWTPERVRRFREDVAYFHFDLVELVEHHLAELRPLLERLLAEVGSGEVHPLPYCTFPAEEAPAAFRFMAQARHRGKILLRLANDTESAAQVRGDATYLITGGLGGLGLQVATWLAGRGARHLVLLGRSAPDLAAQAVLAELARAGVQVRVAQEDVADLTDLKAVVPAGAPPLRGVIHAAGVLADGVFAQQEWDRWAEALRPKVDGAYRLHELTADQPLDFFVLFSSAAAVLGSAGQSGYGAANAFLDALACHRRLQGRPALSVSWGPWAGPGMVTRLETQTSRTLFAGMGRLEPERALSLLGELLDQAAGLQMVVLPIRWPVFLQAHPEARGLPLLEEVLPAGGIPAPVAAASPGPRRPDLVAGTAADRQAGLEAYLVEVLAKVLNCAATDLDATTPIERFGLDSLMQVELASYLRRDLGLILPVDLTLESITARDLAAVLIPSPGRGDRPVEAAPAPSEEALVAELEADVRLDPEISAWDLPAAPTPATEVLLTGATGFVGAHLLEELLRQTRARVWCLVRADSAAAAHRRVMENLAALGLRVDPDRVAGVAGDLEASRLGLAPEAFAELSARVAEIWHAGARVSFLQPYRELAAANVFSVAEVLRLATRTVLKPVHFVSTLGMLASAWRDHAVVVTEAGPVAHGAGLPNGYEQSKWVAEAVLGLARERGVPVTIYRPGLLTGDSRTGEYRNTRDFVSRMLKGCIELGAMPALDNLLELAPVDFAARAMVAIAVAPDQRGRTFHINHPEPATAGELAAWLGEAGYRIELIPYGEWKKRLFDRVAAGHATALDPYLDFLRPLTEAQAALPALDSRQARQVLAAAGIGCPSAAALIRAYLGYLVRTGFLPPP